MPTGDTVPSEGPHAVPAATGSDQDPQASSDSHTADVSSLSTDRGLASPGGFEMSFQDDEYLTMFNNLKLDVKSGKRDITQNVSELEASRNASPAVDLEGDGFETLDMEDMPFVAPTDASPASNSSLESSGEPSKVTDLGTDSKQQSPDTTAKAKQAATTTTSSPLDDKENHDVSSVSEQSSTSRLPSSLVPERTSSLSPMARKKAPLAPASPTTSPLASRGMSSFQTVSPPREMSFNSVIRHSSMHADSVIHHGVATLEDVDLGCDTDIDSPSSPEHFHMKSLDDNMFSVPATLDDKAVLGVKQERAHVDKLVNDKFNLQVENMMLRNNLHRGEGGSQAGGVDALRRAIRENNEMKEKIEQMEKELSRKRDGGIDSEEIRELKERVVNYEEQIEYLEGKQQHQQQQEWEDIRSSSSAFGRSSRLSGSRAPSRAAAAPTNNTNSTNSNNNNHYMSNRSISRQSFISDGGSGGGGPGVPQRQYNHTPPMAHSNRHSQHLDTDEAHVMDQMHKLQNLIDPDGHAGAETDEDSIYSRFSTFLTIITQYIVAQQEKFRLTEQEFQNLEQDYEDIQLRVAQESADEIDALRGEIENLRNDFASQAQENENLHHELSQHREEAQHYEREILALYPDIQTLENNNKRLKKDVEKKTRSLVEMEERLQGMDAELQRATELNEEIGTFAGSLEEQLEELKAGGGVDEKEVLRVKGELLQAQEELETATEQAGLAKKDADTARMELAGIKRERQDLQRETEALREELETRNMELGTRNVELETEKVEVTSLNAKVEGLKAEVASLQASMNQIATVMVDNDIDVEAMPIPKLVLELLNERQALHARISEQESISQSSASELEQKLSETTLQLQLREQFTDDLESQLDEALSRIQHMGNHEARVLELTRQLTQFEEQFSHDRKHSEMEKARLEAQIQRVQADADLRSAAHQKQLSSWQKKLFNVECNRGDFSKSIIEKLANILGPVWKDAHDHDLSQLTKTNSTPSAEVVTKLSNDALHDLGRLVSKGNSEITKQLHQLRLEVDSLKYKNNKHEEQYRSLSNLYKKAGLERDDYKKRLAQSEEERKQMGDQLERDVQRRKLGSGVSSASISSLGSDEEDLGRVQVTARDIDSLQSPASPMGKPFSSVLWGIRNEDIQQRLKLEKEMRASDKAASDKKIKELEDELNEVYRREAQRERNY
ncbi:hypothetical protein CJU90_4951 [Yarrowia sp. C11]|nr:hypothetical protein CJU90_4951 [Yarrowia sp. C11]